MNIVKPATTRQLLSAGWTMEQIEAERDAARIHRIAVELDRTGAPIGLDDRWLGGQPEPVRLPIDVAEVLDLARDGVTVADLERRYNARAADADRVLRQLAAEGLLVTTGATRRDGVTRLAVYCRGATPADNKDARSG